MILRRLPVLLVFIILLHSSLNAVAAPDSSWHSPKDVEQRLKKISQNKRTLFESIGLAPSGSALNMLTIEPRQSHNSPAILVIGNMSGQAPLGTEAALKLVEEILQAGAESAAGSVRWHIIPMANPDGVLPFFEKAQSRGGLNRYPKDEDRDGLFAEDPSEDLNADGLITTMLVPDPGGKWILSDENPLLAVKAQSSQGQRGLYKKEIEGWDNDDDGLYNEDGPGGVNPGHNFPHRFEHWTNSGGLWAADQPETQAILEFAYSHKSIAMILVLDKVNSLRQIPDIEERNKNGRYSIPDDKAAKWNIKPGQSLTMDEIKTVLIENYGIYNITNRQALGYLEEDAATKIDPADFSWWSAVSIEYFKKLEAAGLNADRLPSPKSSVGSVEEWGYFQFGVPTFALDFWSLPLAAQKDSTQLDLEMESVPDDTKKLSDKQQALLQYTEQTKNRKQNDWNGLIGWEKAQLPSGKTVLVGGKAPFAFTTPPAALVDSLLAAPVQFLTTLPAWLPSISFGPLEFISKGTDVYELTVWINNDGPIAYPIAQGTRTRRVPSLIVTLEGAEILEGHARTAISPLPGHGSAKARWLIRVKIDDKINITAEAPSLGKISRQSTASAQGDHK